MIGKNTNGSAGKSIFQKELEKSISRKIMLLVITGGIFFCVAILGINKVTQEYNKEKYLETVTQGFNGVYNSITGFLEQDDSKRIFMNCIRAEGKANDVHYLLGKYNVDAPADIRLILSDDKERILFSSFRLEDSYPQESNYPQESGSWQEGMNLHRREFNRIVGENARKNPDNIYKAVYFFAGDTSDYVFVKPLFDNGRYVGTASVYLNSEEWRGLFSQYQYDTVITNRNGDIIYCSNHRFVPERNTNKYKTEKNQQILWVNENRYRMDYKILQDKQVILYSVIYSPRNSIYALIGVGTILVLGLIWTCMFYSMSRSMAAKTAESVSLLVSEMRIVRKENTDHVIQIRTGDEFEEIAEQINKMVKSINELNVRNVDLVKINSLMEMQNLQAQINPHFIYNTLDNIKYLIVPEPLRAAELIERFTHILRYSIDNTKRNVHLDEDIRYIEDYLVIQKTRFGDRFAYRIDIAQEGLRCIVPKLLLQPLVENSIKYGFKKKMQVTVKIAGQMENGYLVLTVMDNGAGVPKLTLEMLCTMIQSEEMETTHNGLQNINRRIILEYGRQSGMQLDSVDGEGFLVTLRLWMGEKQDV